MSNNVLASNHVSKKAIYLFILPSILVLLVMVFYPLLYGFYLSTTNLSLSNFQNPSFIGLSNYVDIIKEGVIFKTFFRTIIWTSVNIFAHVSIGLGLALILNAKMPGSALFRILLIIPWALPQYVAVLTFKGMFNTQFGAFNLILGKFGLPSVNWLSDANMAFVSSIITNIWLGFPFMMMICLGGLQSIPKSIYEAADIDGASSFAKFKNITLPLLKPVLVPAVVLGTVWTFNMVNVIVVLTGNHGKEGTQILVTEVYRLSFSFYRYAYAAAYSVLIFFILFSFVVLFIKKANVFGSEDK